MSAGKLSVLHGGGYARSSFGEDPDGQVSLWSSKDSKAERSGKHWHGQGADQRLVAWAMGSSTRAAGQSAYEGAVSLVEHLFTLRVIVERARAKREKLFCCFVDLKHAFAAVPASRLWEKLEEEGVPEPLLEQARKFYEGRPLRLALPPGLSAEMVGEVGMAGGPLSPAVFSLFINDLERLLLKDGGTSPDLQGVLVPVLMYGADNLVLVSRTAAGLRIHMKAFERYCERHELAMGSAQVLIFGAERRWVETQAFSLMGERVPVPTSLIYLGIPLHEGKGLGWAVQWRATCGIKALQDMFDGLTEKESSDVRSLFEERVLTALTYGCEAWAVGLSPTGWSKLEVVHQRFLQECIQRWTTDSRALRLAKFGEVRVPLEALARTIEFVRRLQCQRGQRRLPNLAFAASRLSKGGGWYVDVTNWFQSWGISVANLPTERGPALRELLKSLYWKKVWISPLSFSGKSTPSNPLHPSTSTLVEYQSENYMRRLCGRVSLIADATVGSECVPGESYANDEETEDLAPNEQY